VSRIWDVIVVGAGNAALCAALAAREAGADVLVLERAPPEESGGNSRYTAGSFCFVYSGADDIKALVPDLTDREAATTDFGRYPEERFYDDMFRMTRYRTDPGLCEQLVTRSRDTMLWLRAKGIRFNPIWGRQGAEIDGRYTFNGDLTLEAWGGGAGLVESETAAVTAAGIEVRYGVGVTDLLFDGTTVQGVRAKSRAGVVELRSRAVVLACGGFQANAEWRARYLGPGWELAKVRGTRFNVGDGLRMSLAIGAMPAGQWSGSHSVAWDNNAPPTGDLTVGDAFQKYSYQFGIMINADGRRFVDEGADVRLKTYSKLGRIILAQPDQFAWQVFDNKVLHLLRDEYRIKRVSKVSAGSIGELATRMEGVNAAAFLDEVRAFNGAVDTAVAFDQRFKDGRGTSGLALNKSNWAQTIDEPPFEAYQVGCGITFTFGGLAVTPTTAQVLDTASEAIPGLYAAGEIVGGLFYFGYPGGTGLMAGSVFGRIAGMSAAAAARGADTP
jgi:tricarballylate dehydrogenase